MFKKLPGPESASSALRIDYVASPPIVMVSDCYLAVSVSPAHGCDRPQPLSNRHRVAQPECHFKVNFDLRPAPRSSLFPPKRPTPAPRRLHALLGRCGHDRCNARPAPHAPGFLGRAVAGYTSLHVQRVLGCSTSLVRMANQIRKQTALNLR